MADLKEKNVPARSELSKKFVREEIDHYAVVGRSINALSRDIKDDKFRPSIKDPMMIKKLKLSLTDVKMKEMSKQDRGGDPTLKGIFEKSKIQFSVSSLKERNMAREITRKMLEGPRFNDYGIVEKRDIAHELGQHFEREKEVERFRKTLEEDLKKYKPERYRYVMLQDLDGDGFTDIAVIDGVNNCAAVSRLSLTDRFDDIAMERERVEEDIRRKEELFKEEYGKNFKVYETVIYNGDEGLTPEGVVCVNKNDLMEAKDIVPTLLQKSEKQVEREYDTNLEDPAKAANVATADIAERKTKSLEEVCREARETAERKNSERECPQKEEKSKSTRSRDDDDDPYERIRA